MPVLVHAAQFEIVDVQYDPDGADKGREWVRIYNTSGAPVDMTGWKFVEGGVNHGLKAVMGSVVPAGGYAVIADDATSYLAEHGNTTDIVFDSSFSLSNTGETVAVADANKVVVATHTYVAAPKPAPVAKTTTKKSISKSVAQTDAPQSIVATAVAAPIAAAPPTDWSLSYWLLGLGALVVVGGAALFLVPKRQGTGYEIIDEHD